MKKLLMADVLWNAANEYLWDGAQYEGNEYSCTAIETELDWALLPFKRRAPIWQFIESLGCNTTSFSCFRHDFKSGEERQGVRYMWLLLAMHVAEDEGLTI